jgi:hypothetical protein
MQHHPKTCPLGASLDDGFMTRTRDILPLPRDCTAASARAQQDHASPVRGGRQARPGTAGHGLGGGRGQAWPGTAKHGQGGQTGQTRRERPGMAKHDMARHTQTHPGEAGHGRHGRRGKGGRKAGKLGQGKSGTARHAAIKEGPHLSGG